MHQCKSFKLSWGQAFDFFSFQAASCESTLPQSTSRHSNVSSVADVTESWEFRSALEAPIAKLESLDEIDRQVKNKISKKCSTSSSFFPLPQKEFGTRFWSKSPRAQVLWFCHIMISLFSYLQDGEERVRKLTKNKSSDV